MNTHSNNFGRWILFNLDKFNKSQVWFEEKSQLSPSSISRWTKGQYPKIDNYFAACKTISKLQNRSVMDIIEDTLEFMPYLISNRVEPRKCPTCGQEIKNG